MADTSPEAREYKVTGMSCGNCERHVREAVGELDGVSAVVADAGDGSLRVTGTGLDDRAIAAAVDEAGYELSGS